MDKQTPAEKRSALIDLLWKLKHGVQNKENIDFSSLLANPMYRRAVVQRFHTTTHSEQLMSLINQIKKLDPGVDLSTDATLPAFKQRRPRQNLGALAQQHARYFVGAGLMLIAVTVLAGLVAIKLSADGFGKPHTVQTHTQSSSAQHLAQGDVAAHRP